MKIHRIHFKNLNSLYGTHTLVLNEGAIAESGLFAITGDTGAGKSTILDAITLALYGKIHRNKDIKEIMSYGTSESSAEVEFSVDDSLFMAQWNIWKARKKVDGKIQAPERKLSKWNTLSQKWDIETERVSDINKSIEEITSLDYSRFSRSVLLSQGDFDKFLKADNKERGNLLEKLTRTTIYSDISKAAFLKNKEELDKFKHLQFQIDSLDILSEEVIQNIQEEKTNLSEKQQNIQAKIKEFSTHQNKLQQLDKQKNKRSKIHDQLADWQQKFKALELDLSRLDIHKRTRHLHQDIYNRKNLIRKTSSDLDAIFEQKNTLQKHLEKETELKNNLTEKESFFTHQKAEKDNLVPIWNQVIKLDTEIETREKIVRPKRKEYTEINNELQTQNKNFHALENDYNQKNELFIEVENWLENNKIDAELIEDLPNIKNPLSNLSKIKEKNIDTKKNIDILQQKRTEKKKLLEKKEHLLSKENKALSEVEQSFLELFSDADMAKIHERIEELHANLEQEQKTTHVLTQLQALETQYKEQIKLLNEQEKTYEFLLLEELNALKLFLILDGEWLEIQDVLAYKKNIWEQQKALKNYELERNQLNEGEECPLCLSKEHPFRNMENFQPRVDIALKELKEVENKLQKIDNQRKEKLLQLEEIENRKLILKKHKEYGGEILFNYEKIKTLENTIAEQIKNASKNVIKAWKSDSLPALETATKTAISTTQQKIKTSQDLTKKHEALQKKILVLTGEKQTLENDLGHIQERIKQDQTAYKIAQEEENKIEQNLQQYFEKYGITTEHSQEEILEKRKNIYTEKKDTHTQLKEKLFELKNNKNKLEIIIKNNTEKLTQLKKEGIKAGNELKKIQAERNQLLAPEKTGENEEKIWNEKLARIEKEIFSTKKLLDKIQIEIAQEKSTITARESAREEELKQLSEIEKRLQKFIENEKINSLETLNKSVLSISELSRIETQKQDLDKNKTQLEQSEKNLSEEIESLEIATEELPNLKTVQQEIQQLEISNKQHHEKLGALQERLATNQAKIQKSQDLIHAKNHQAKECSRWSELNELIGQADGQKFRAFAQGLTLKRLTILANLHLQELNDRYQIHKPNNKDLELQIIDTYQANHTRSVNTLSGGESFLVSLALALGLSDLAGNKKSNRKIESLFIDEGFGTLDEDTLEMALQTLEKLHLKGKTIGVISHVQQLKERIPIQIQIEKQGNGKSKMIMPS